MTNKKSIEKNRFKKIQAMTSQLADIISKSGVNDSDGVRINLYRLVEELNACNAEREQAERILRVSEAQQRAIIQSSPGAIIATDSKANIVSWNPSAEELFGYAEDEIRGRSITVVIHRKHKKRYKAAFTALKQKINLNGLPYSMVMRYEFQSLRKDGSVFLAEVSLGAGKAGRKTCFTTIIHDITEQNQILSRLQESEEKYRTTFENTGTATVIIEEDTTLSLVNNEFEHLSGYSRQEIEGRKSWTEFVADEDLPRMKEYHRLRRESGESAPGQYEFRFKDRNENLKDILLTIAMIPGTKKSIASLLNVTEKKRMENSIRESEVRFRAITQTATDAIIMMDSAGRITNWNPASEKMFGYTDAEAIGKELHLFLAPGRYHEPYLKGFRKFAETGTGPVVEKTVELEALKKDGTEFPIEVSTSALQVNDGWHAVGIIRDITHRKQAEEALRSSEFLHRSLSENLPGIVYRLFLKDNNRMQFFNDQLQPVTGYTEAEITTGEVCQIDPLIVAEDRNRVIDTVKGAIEKKETFQVEYRIEHKDGGIRYLIERGRPVPSRGQEVEFIDGVIFDETARILAEEALSKKERYFRTLLQSMHDDILVIGHDYVITDLNNRFRATSELKRDQIIGSYCYAVSHGYDEPCEMKGELCLLQEVFKTGKADNCQHIHTRKDGSQIPVDILFAPMKDAAGNTTHVIESIRDISAIMAATSALKESEEKFRTLFEDSRDAIYVTTPDGQFLNVNQSFLDMFGLTMNELTDMNARYFYVDMEEHKRYVQEIETHGSVKDYKLKLKKKDGTPIDCLVTATKWEQEKLGVPVYQGIIRDITEQLQAQHKIEAALERAERADRLKTQFLANMSHEIRTPLNAVMGFSAILHDRFQNRMKPEEKEFFKSIKSGGERLLRTVEEILDISQVESGVLELKTESVYLTELVETIVNEMAPQANKKGLKLHFTSELNDSMVNVDKFRISQAISNLVDNAIKYTEKGEINLFLTHEKDQFKLIIKDTGIGISLDYQKHLFELFSQESTGYSKKFQGIGLGLALTKRYLSLNGVSINVDSRKGKGATFSLVFPMSDTPIKMRKENQLE